MKIHLKISNSRTTSFAITLIPILLFVNVSRAQLDGCYPETRIENQSSRYRPALAVFNDKMYMVHVGAEENDIWIYNSVDCIDCVSFPRVATLEYSNCDHNEKILPTSRKY